MAPTVILLVALTGCGQDPLTVAGKARPGGESIAGKQPSAARRDEPDRVTPDVLVVSDSPLPPARISALHDIPGVTAGTALGLGSVAIHGQAVTIGAVLPADFRKFAPPGTAGADRVWKAVARGEAAAAHAVAKTLDLPLGEEITLTGSRRHSTLKVGALATTFPPIDVVVNRKVGKRLGIQPSTSLVLSNGPRAPAGKGGNEGSERRAGRTDIAGAARRILGKDARVDVLAPRPSQPVTRRAFLSGQDAERALGSFSYRYYPDGTIQPDPAWVESNIRTEEVPILGAVTCHRLLLPQLRGALREVVRRGLADEIHPAQYGGCYVPRFIGRDPDNPISLHTWGIAVDLNVARNQRGTAGRIDRRVVAIFSEWGFAWGGDWDWPDPMHFELEAVLQESR